MSAVVIDGYMSLTNPRRGSLVNPHTNKLVWFNYYNAAVVCKHGTFPAEIRIFSSSPGSLLQSHTVAQVVGQLFMPSRMPTSDCPALIDAERIHPFPGNPDSYSYEENLPEATPVSMTVAGNVLASATQQHGIFCTFELAVSAYVRDRKRQFNIQCIWDASSPRWRKVPRPQVDSCFFAFGTCDSVIAHGMLIMEVEIMAPNLGPITRSSPLVPAVAQAAQGTGVTGGKRRFVTISENPDAVSPPAYAETLSKRRRFPTIDDAGQ